MILSEYTAIYGGVFYGGISYPFMMSSNPELIKLGKNIAKARREKGLSQDDLALEAEIGRRTINRIEVGSTDPRLTTLIKIATTLNIDLIELLKEICSDRGA